MKRNMLVSAILLLLLLSITTPAFSQAATGTDYDVWLSKLDGARYTRDFGTAKYTFTIRGHHVICSRVWGNETRVFSCGVSEIQGQAFERDDSTHGVIEADGSYMVILGQRCRLTSGTTWDCPGGDGGVATTYPRE